MEEKRSVDAIRSSSGYADIGTSEDGAIIEMITIGKKAFVVKERSIYEFMFADEVDPKRENPKLPSNIQRKLLDLGTESELVSRVFLASKDLLKQGFLGTSFDSDRAMLIAFEALQELSIMQAEITDYIQTEKEVIAEYESRKGKKQSYAIPSISNVQSRCKTIFHKADQVTQALMEIITLFYPDAGLTKKSDFKGFYKFIKDTYGEKDSFVVQVGEASPYLELIRALRDSLEHRLHFVTVKDFELQVNSNVNVPTIELKSYHGCKLQRTDVAVYLDATLQNILNIFELFIAHLANKRIKGKVMPSQVLLIPEERRINKHIKYSYYSPIGEGGFFHTNGMSAK